MSSEIDSLPLIRTKLYRPRITGDLVSRPRLLERLDRRWGRPLTLVCAPAGYGKTTLVASWLEGRGGGTPLVPSAWLSLDEGDDNLAIFLTCLLAAIQTLFTNAGSETLMLGSRMALLLDQVRRKGVAPDYIAQILAAFEATDNGRPTTAETASLVPGPSSTV